MRFSTTLLTIHLLGTGWAVAQSSVTPVDVDVFLYDTTLNAAPRGANPYGGLLEGNDGLLYGTTTSGGAGCGVVFSVPAGAPPIVPLFTFPLSEGACLLGSYPQSRLMQWWDNNYYGLTNTGGANYSGAAFVVDALGNFQQIYSFCSQPGCADGSQPVGRLVGSGDGGLLGVTSSGGANGVGTIFEITPSGAVITRHSFGGSGDGQAPSGGLIAGSDGNLYGTTQFGGASNSGTVFRMTPDGTVTVLYSFLGGSSEPADGFAPTTLIQASNLKLYGTTISGGTFGGGTVFELGLDGAYRILYNLGGSSSAGSQPAGLLETSDGSLYGTTSAGGALGAGTIYAIDKQGNLTVAGSFDPAVNGYPPAGSLVQASDGNIYGTSLAGGAAPAGSAGAGAVFQVVTGLPAPAPFILGFAPQNGGPGTRVFIGGGHFVQASAVSFNGVPAQFLTPAANRIIAIVPLLASTGPITITGPGGTATSSQTFTVNGTGAANTMHVFSVTP